MQKRPLWRAVEALAKSLGGTLESCGSAPVLVTLEEVG